MALIECLNHSNPEVRKYIDKLGIEETYRQYILFDYNLPDFNDFLKHQRNPSMRHNSLMELLSTMLDLSQIPVKDLEEIKSILPVNTEGAFWRNAIYLGKESTNHTAYEEAFHAIFQAIIPATQKADLLKVGRYLLQSSLNGKSINDYLSEQRIKYPQLFVNQTVDQQLDRISEEFLANEFVEWNKNKGKYKSNISKKLEKYLGKNTASFIDKVIAFFQKLSPFASVYKNNRALIETFFAGIEAGRYKNSKIRTENQDNASPFTRLIEMTDGTKMSASESVNLESSILSSVLDKMELEKNEGKLDEVIDFIIKGYSNWYEAKASQSEDAVARKNYFSISNILKPSYSVLNEEFEEEQQRNEEYFNVVKDIKRLLADVKSITDVIDDAEVQENDMAKYDEQANQKGYTAQSLWLRSYISTAGTVINEEEIDKNPDAVKIIQSVDPAKVYYSLLRASRNSKSDEERIKTFINFAGLGSNEQNKIFLKEKLKKDIVDVNGNRFSNDEWNRLFSSEGDMDMWNEKLNPKSKRLLAKIMKGFDMWIRENVQLSYDVAQSKAIAFNANTHGVDAIQVESWKKNYEMFTHEENPDRLLRDSVTANIESIKEHFVVVDNMKEFNDNVEWIQKRFNELGISLAKEYVEFSLWRKQEVGGKKDIIDRLSEKYDKFRNNVGEDVIDIEFINQLATANEKDPKTGIFTSGSFKITGRLKKIANGNAIFDENALDTTYIDAEGNTIYLHQNKTFNLQFLSYFSDYNAKLIFDNLANGSNVVQSVDKDGNPVTFTEDKGFFQNNFLIKWLKADKYNNVSNFSSFSVEGIVPKSFSADISDEDKEYARNNSVTFSSMQTRDFDLYRLNIFFTKYFKGKNADFAPVFVGNNEAKNTAEFINMPVHKNLIDNEGKLSEEGKGILYQELKNEYDRIQRIHKEYNDNSNPNRYEKYNTGKTKKVSITIMGGSNGPQIKTAFLPVALKGGKLQFTGDYRGMQFTNAVYGLSSLDMDFSNIANATENKETGEIELRITGQEANKNLMVMAVFGIKADSIKGLITDSIATGVDTILSSQIDDLVNAKIISRDKDGNVLPIPEKNGDSLLTSEANALYVTNLEISLRKKLMSDFVNTLSLNQLMIGDAALSVKNDFVDLFKRNGGRNAAIVGFRNEFTDASLGITKPFKFVKSFIFKEPKSFADNDDAGHASGDPAGVDLADAQNWTSVDYFRKALWGQTKLTSFHARVLNDIESGKPIARETMQRLLDSGTVFNSMKTVGFTGKVYHKKSDKMLTREETSIPEFITESEYKDAIGNTDLSKGKFGVLEGAVLPDNSDYTFYNDGDKTVYVKWKPKKEKQELHDLRLRLAGFSMNDDGKVQYTESDEVDVAMPLSASKMTSVNVYNGEGFLKVRSNNISAMDANFYGLQTENPSGKEKIVDPTQMLEIIMSELKDKISKTTYNGKKYDTNELWDKLNEQRDSLTFNVAYKELFEQVKGKDISQFKEMILRGVVSSGGDIQTQQFLNPNIDYNLNIPLVEGKFIQQFFAYFTKEILSQKVSGDSKVLVSSYGHNMIKKLTKTIVDGKEHIGWEVINEQHPEYHAAQEKNLSNLSKFRYDHKIVGKEVTQESNWFDEARKMLDSGDVYFIDALRHNVPEIDNGSIVGWFSESLMPTHDLDIEEVNERYNKYFGVRIPSQDKQSAMNIKWVGMLPAYMGSSIVVPKEVVYLSGADFDVDKMYLHTTATYVNKEGEIVPYGSATGIEEKWFEYMQSIKKNKIVKEKFLTAKETDEEYIAAKKAFGEKVSALKEEVDKRPMIDAVKAKLDGLYNSLQSKSNTKLLDTLKASHKEYTQQEAALKSSFINLIANGTSEEVSAVKLQMKLLATKMKANATKTKNIIDSNKDVSAHNQDVWNKINDANAEKKAIYDTDMQFAEKLSALKEEFNAVEKKVFYKVLASLDLPTKKENYDEKYVIGIINNKLLEIKQKALNNLETLKEGGISKTPITLTALTELKNEPEFLDTPKKYGSHWFGAHSNSHKQNTTGKGLIGVSVVFMLGYTNALKLGVSINKKYLPKLDGKNNELGANKFHEFTTDKKGNQIRVMDIISTITSANTDEAKEQLNAYFGMTNESQAVVLQLVSLGHPLKTALMFVKQPIIVNYIKRLQSLNYSLRKQSERKIGRVEKDKKTALKETVESIGLKIKDYENDKGESYTTQELSDRLVQGKIMKPLQILQVLKDFNNLTEITSELGKFVGIVRIKKGLSPELSQFDKLKDNIDDIMYGDKTIINFAERLNDPVNEGISKQLLNYVNDNGIVDKISNLAGGLLLQKNDKFSTPLKQLLSNLSLKRGEEEKITKEVSSFVFTTLDGVSNDEGALKLLYSSPNSLANKIQKLSLSDKSFKDNPLVKKLMLTFNKESNQIPIDVVSIDTISKLTGKEQETLIDSFYSLYISSNPAHHQIAKDMFTYFKLKDGLQFGRDSLSKIFPASQFLDMSAKLNLLMEDTDGTNYSSDTLINNREEFIDSFLTNTKNIQYLKGFNFGQGVKVSFRNSLKGIAIIEHEEAANMYDYFQSNGVVYKAVSLNQGITLAIPIVSHGNKFASSSSSKYKVVSASKAIELSFYANNFKNILADNKKEIEDLVQDKFDDYAINAAQADIDKYYEKQKQITRAITKNGELVTVDRMGDISSQRFVNGATVVSRNVIATYLDAVKKNGNNKPLEHSSQSNDKKSPEVIVNGQSQIITNEMLWMQNQFGFYDLINQETGELIITNVDLGYGVQKVLDERLVTGEQNQSVDDIDLFSVGNTAKKTGPLKTNDEVIQSEKDKSGVADFPTLNIFSVSPIQSVDKKAIVKASIATKYIGFADGIANSSTALYARQAGEYANTGDYNNNDVIFVSVGGKRGDESLRKQQQDRTIKEAIKALDLGATIIVDNKAYIASNSYNEGELRLQKNLEAKDYIYSETTINGQVLGVWKKEIIQPSQLDRLSQELQQVEAEIDSFPDTTDGIFYRYFKNGGRIKPDSFDTLLDKNKRSAASNGAYIRKDGMSYDTLASASYAMAGREDVAGDTAVRNLAEFIDSYPNSWATPYNNLMDKKKQIERDIQDLEKVNIPKTDLQQPNC